MSTEKLSELKAAAMAATPGPWAYEAHGDTGQYGVGVLLNDNDEPQSGKQEQGEMLVVESVAPEINEQDNASFIAAANPAAVLALLAELEAKDKRIDELEYELACVMADNEYCRKTIARKDAAIDTFVKESGDAQKRIAELEAKLATPVRLSCETHPRCRTQHAKDVRTAGFKVAGDDQ